MDSVCDARKDGFVVGAYKKMPNLELNTKN